MYEPPVLIVFVVINILHFGLYVVFNFLGCCTSDYNLYSRPCTGRARLYRRFYIILGLTFYLQTYTGRQRIVAYFADFSFQSPFCRVFVPTKGAFL